MISTVFVTARSSEDMFVDKKDFTTPSWGGVCVLKFCWRYWLATVI
jgi:hypothetical protein